MDSQTFLKKVEAWEAAWAEYINALEDYDSLDAGIYNGEDWVFHVSRISGYVKDAQQKLRSIDREFCEKLGI